MARRQHIDYGSPDEHDATAELEEDVAWVVQQFTQLVQERGTIVLNRPLGSKSVPPEAQLEDWLTVRDDPAYWDQQWLDRAALIGPEKAKLELLRHDREMQKRWASG